MQFSPWMLDIKNMMKDDRFGELERLSKDFN